MLSTLALLCLTLAGRLDFGPPSPPGFRLQALPWRDLEEYRLFQLELSRNRRAGLEEMNEMFEEHLLFFSTQRLLQPEQIARVQQQMFRLLDKGRMKVEFMKRFEREMELWGEQRKLNPGSETDRDASDRVGKLFKEEKDWEKAWERGLIAPPPREKR